MNLLDSRRGPFLHVLYKLDLADIKSEYVYICVLNSVDIKFMHIKVKEN